MGVWVILYNELSDTVHNDIILYMGKGKWIGSYYDASKDTFYTTWGTF